MSCRYRGRTGRPEDAAENVSNLEVFGLDAHVGDDVGDDANGGKGGCRAQERAGSVVKLRRCSLAHHLLLLLLLGLRTLTLGVTAPSLPCSKADFTAALFFRWFLACRWSTGHKAGIRVWKFFKSSNLQELALLLLASQQSAKVDKQH